MLALVTTHDADVPVFLRPLDGNSSDKEHLSAAQAYQRLAKWAQDWRERAPKAVATLERDFEQTLVYYSLESVAREWISTTSLLERTNRQSAEVSPGCHLWQSQGSRSGYLSPSPTAPCSLDQRV